MNIMNIDVFGLQAHARHFGSLVFITGPGCLSDHVIVLIFMFLQV